MRCPTSALTLVLALVGGGCADPWSDPDALPVRFVLEEKFGGNVVVADLDRDGRDETLMYGQINNPGVASLLFQSPTGLRVEQVNAAGRALRPTALELDGDDPLEVVFPYVRGDTLHAMLLDHRGRRLRSIVLATGWPRVMDDGVVPWDPFDPWLTAEDVDGDGRPELVTLLTTGFSPLGRGLYVVDPRTGERVGHAAVGVPNRPALARFGREVEGAVWDVDGDGVREWAFVSDPSQNGGDAGGLDDRHSYVGVFELGPTPGLLWADELGGTQTVARAWAGDFDGDGARELLVSSYLNEAGRGTLSVRDPATRAVRASGEFEYVQVTVVGRGPSSPPRILLLTRDSEVVELDGALDVVGRTALPVRAVSFDSAPDLDGDGREEVLVAADGRLVWTDDAFHPLAVMPTRHALPVPVQRVAGEPVRAGFFARPTFDVYRIEPNPAYLVHRYGPVTVGLAALAIVFGVGVAYVRLRRRSATLTARLAGHEGAFDEVAWRLTARRVVHDLRNPLTSVLLNAENLRRAALVERDPEAAEHYARRIEERVERLRGVTRNFLKFVDLEPPALREVAPADFLASVAQELREDLPPDVELVVRTDGNGAVPDVRLDPEQMASVVENLVANAVNALPEGGRLTLATHAARGLQADADPEPRDWAVLEVRDAGTGIDPAVRDRLFEPGVTGTTGGAGFGLAVVRKTVSDHGGYVEVESEPGAGTVVSVFLPAVTAD